MYVLKNLKIKLYKSIKNFNADFTNGFNAIVGPGNSGKTTILELIQKIIFIEHKKKFTIPDDLNETKGHYTLKSSYKLTKSIQQKLGIVEKEEKNISICATLETPYGKKRKIEITNNEIKINDFAYSKDAFVREWHLEGPTQCYLYANPSKEINKKIFKDILKRQIKKPLKKEFKTNTEIANKICLEYEEYAKQIKKPFDFSDTKIIGHDSKSHFNPIIKVDNIPIELHGSGLNKMFLAQVILGKMAEGSDDIVFLIDEIENSLSKDNEKLFMEHLDAKPYQYIFTTHRLSFANNLKNKLNLITLIRGKETKDYIYKINDIQKIFSDSFPKKVVFVEGVIDLIHMPKIEGVLFLQCRGASKIVTNIEENSGIKNTKIYAIFDSDEAGTTQKNLIEDDQKLKYEKTIFISDEENSVIEDYFATLWKPLIIKCQKNHNKNTKFKELNCKSCEHKVQQFVYNINIEWQDDEAKKIIERIHSRVKVKING